jgi:uncharacterized coiled-coil DUF342 family protein
MLTIRKVVICTMARYRYSNRTVVAAAPRKTSAQFVREKIAADDYIREDLDQYVNEMECIFEEVDTTLEEISALSSDVVNALDELRTLAEKIRERIEE